MGETPPFHPFVTSMQVPQARDLIRSYQVAPSVGIPSSSHSKARQNRIRLPNCIICWEPSRTIQARNQRLKPQVPTNCLALLITRKETTMFDSEFEAEAKFAVS